MSYKLLLKIYVGVFLFLTSIVHAQKIEFSETEFNFGDVKQGDVLVHEFSFKNSSDNDLIIRKLNPSCGCLAAVADTGTLAAGAKSSVRVTFDTNGFQGSKTKRVRIYSNDVLNSSLILSVSANIIPDISVIPEKIDLKEVVIGQGASTKLDISRYSQSNSKVTDVFTKSQFLDVKLSKDKESIFVAISKDLPIGQTRTQIFAKTNSPSNPTINIPVFIEVIGKYSINPLAVNFGIVALGSSSQHKIIKISNRDGSNVPELQDIEIDNPSVRVEREISSDPKVLLLSVKLTPISKGIVRGSFTLKFLEDENSYQIPFYGVIDDL